ncbi:N-acetyltransferase GCN5 [Salinisphaera sp. C84B14]|uniref:GNAT family N-acetyltransferase n=1 Tax=Salinisphaera sp. C84B14 TaxID=1304155 RepID=UPI00333FC973
MISMPQRLSTPRLTLRVPHGGDADAIFAFASDPEVTRFMTWAQHVDLDDSSDFLDDVAEGWSSGEDYCWLIEHAERGGIGTVACSFSEHGAEIGYVLARSAWREGFGREAAAAVFDAAQSIDDLYRIWATCDTENAASKRILEALGMVYEGCLQRWSPRPNHADRRNGPRDVFMYAWTR